MIARSLPVQWTLHPRHQPERGLALARELGAPPAVGLVLVNRGIDDLEAARRFLDPALEDLHEPAGLCDLGVAVERIRRAITDGERILVHGDYDVDGITATYLVYAVLRDLGAQVEYRIPHRTRDGYGLTEAGVDEARRRGCGLIVTVDCGVTAVEAVTHARTLGIDVVVTDHHEPPAVLPPALAVVDPLRPDCTYPFKSLAGVGVAFKLAEALLKGRGGIERAREHLDVVALGTIADVVPLVGENRVLARLGLDLLNRTQRPGLRAMIDVAGLGGRRLASSHVAFVIAPRINAAGRMGHAEQGLRLLLAPDDREGRAYAESLDEDNARRRQEDERALVEAEQRVRTELGWPDCSSIVLWSEGWHPGVIGIVASRLVERFQRPTILVALDGERGRGSGRSLAAVDLHRTLDRMSDLLESHGGHALAAGLSVRRERLPELRRRFEALVREQAGPEDFVKRLTLDGDLALRDCDLDLIEWLDRLSPHGLGNPEPLFRARDVEVESCSAVRNGHLKLKLRDGTGTADAIGFGMGALAPELPRGQRCEVAFVPSANEWMGETRVQLKLKGVRPS